MKKNYAIALLSLASLVGTASFAAPLSAQTTNDQEGIRALEELCAVVAEEDTFQCLLEQSTHLNRAKNLARQRGERDNGGIRVVETEPSMHGPSAEAPYVIELGEGSTRYIFTFRVRPRATEDYTNESQVAVTYTYEGSMWDIETLYNRQIDPTVISYADELASR